MALLGLGLKRLVVCLRSLEYIGADDGRSRVIDVAASPWSGSRWIVADHAHEHWRQSTAERFDGLRAVAAEVAGVVPKVRGLCRSLSR